MIKVNELRYGNIISHNSIPFQLDSVENYPRMEKVSDGSPNEQKIHVRDLDPIYLTSEIFEKSGFTKHQNEWSMHRLSFIVEFCVETMAYHFSGGEGICHGTGCVYLHQMQNLYFALTGEDMDVHLQNIQSTS